MTIIISIISGLLSGIFGKLGGLGDDFWKQHKAFPRWMFRSWVRDWLIAPLCALVFLLLGVHSWWLLLTIPLIGGALSTYWDFLFKFDNFWFHGFIIGIASFPVAIATGNWVMFGVRCLILAIWMGACNGLRKYSPLPEEFSRYLIVPSTLFLIC